MVKLQVLPHFLTALIVWTGVASVDAGAFPGCREPDRSSVPAESRQQKDPYPEEYYIAVVGKERRVEHLDDAGVWYPWALAGFLGYELDRTCLAECRKDGPFCARYCARAATGQKDVLHAINAEGFIRTDYESAQLLRLDAETPTFRKVAPFSVYHLRIGSCGLKSGVHCEEDSVLLRKWGRSYYLIAPLEMVRDTKGRYYVSPFSFGKETRPNIRDMIVPISPDYTSGWSGCYYVGGLTVDKYKDMKNSPFAAPDPKVADPNETLCVTHGIPVSQMFSALNTPQLDEHGPGGP